MPYNLEDMRTMRINGPISEIQVRQEVGPHAHIVVKNIGPAGSPVFYVTFADMETAIETCMGLDGATTERGTISSAMCAAPDARRAFTNLTSFYDSAYNM